MYFPRSTDGVKSIHCSAMVNGGKMNEVLGSGKEGVPRSTYVTRSTDSVNQIYCCNVVNGGKMNEILSGGTDGVPRSTYGVNVAPLSTKRDNLDEIHSHANDEKFFDEKYI